MASTGGSTRQELAEISALIENNRVQTACELMEALIRSLDKDAVVLVSPDLRALIARLLPKRRKQMAAMLEAALLKPQRMVVTARDQKSSAVSVRTPALQEQDKIQVYASMLAELGNHHIFQWATFYRDTVGYIFKDLLGVLKEAETWDSKLESVSREFARHAQEIYQRGHVRLAAGGFVSEVSEAKSMNGLLRFLYLKIGRASCRERV